MAADETDDVDDSEDIDISVLSQMSYEEEKGGYNHFSDDEDDHVEELEDADPPMYDSDEEETERKQNQYEFEDLSTESGSAYFHDVGSEFNEEKRYTKEEDEALYQAVKQKFLETDQGRIRADRQGHSFGATIEALYAAGQQALLSVDDQDPLFDGAPTTKGEFARDTFELLRQNSLGPHIEHQLFNLLKKHLPDTNLPVEYTKGGNYKSILRTYRKENVRTLAYDICPDENCLAFVGTDEKDIKCRECGAERYKHWSCGRIECKNGPYGFCTHTARRTPKKQLHYRPLTFTIQALLGTRGFLLALKYKHRPYRRFTPGAIMDIMDGSEAIDAMTSMHRKYLKYVEDNPDQKDVVEVNLVLSDFYDGAQIHKHKYSNFSALLTTIQNLPPSYRPKLGVGMFVTALFTANAGSGAEDFLFVDLYIRELFLLSKGVTMSVKGVNYLVQARLIHHTADTKAIEPMIKAQATASRAGCPLCYGTIGTWSTDLWKCYFGGHRQYMDIRHLTRVNGQTKNCCPEGFYTRHEDIEKPEAMQPVKPVRVKHNFVCCQILKPADLLAAQTMLRKTHIVAENYAPLHHTNVVVADFLNDDKELALFYPTGDLRPQIQHKRKTDRFYYINALEAMRRKKPQSGMHGFWVFGLLSYASITRNVMWDPFHVLMNLSKNVLNNFKGKRSGDKVDMYCTAYNVHPKVSANRPNKKRKHSDIAPKSRFPWVLAQKHQDRVDAFINCMQVPMGYKNQFCIDNVMIHTGNTVYILLGVYT
jgi:hypothetical protein